MGGQSAVKLAGGDVASLFARDAGWRTGHVLLVAARAEDERETWDSIPPTVCDRPNIDYQMELLISRWHAIFNPPSPPTRPESTISGPA